TVAVAYRVNGVIDTSFNGLVTLAINTGPAGGSLGGTLTAHAVQGVATFTALTLNRAGNYTLAASVAGVPPVVSPPITVTASSLTESVSPRAVIQRRPFVLTFTALDSTGNVAQNFEGPFRLEVVKKPPGATIMQTLRTSPSMLYRPGATSPLSRLSRRSMAR